MLQSGHQPKWSFLLRPPTSPPGYCLKKLAAGGDSGCAISVVLTCRNLEALTWRRHPWLCASPDRAEVHPPYVGSEPAVDRPRGVRKGLCWKQRPLVAEGRSHCLANKIQTKVVPPVQSPASIGMNPTAIARPTKIDIDLLPGSGNPVCASGRKAELRAGGWSRVEEDWLQIEKTMARNESCRVEMQRVMFPAMGALRSPSAR